MTRSKGRLSTFALATAVVTLTAATVLGFAGSAWWPFDLFSHFRLQLAVLLLLAFAIALVLKRWKLATAAMLGVAANAAVIAPLYVHQPPPAPAGQAPGSLKLLHLNAWNFRNREPAALARYLETSDFDLVLVQESNTKLIQPILESGAPFALFRASDAYRQGETVAFVNTSRAGELDVISMKRLRWGRVNELRITWHGRELAVLSPHLTIPGPGGNNAEREAECNAICDWMNAQTVPTIVIGDFNATPWCKEFRTLLAGTELVNSQQGFGVQCTWPRRPPFALSWMFSIPIDHCLHSTDFGTLDRRVGPYLGSDHLPLEVELGLRP